MKEERGLLREAIDPSQPKEVSKTKKYIRIALGCIAVAFLLLVVVSSAALRKFGG